MNDKKISIAFFLPTLDGGGTERIIANIANNLDRQKYNVSIVLAKARGSFLNEIKKDVQIINLNISGDLKLFFRLIKYFRNEKNDIFVSVFSRINIICTSAKIFSRSDAKIIIMQHSVFSQAFVTAETFLRRLFACFFMPILAKIIYPKADQIICVSNSIAEDISKIIGHNDKIKIIYNPAVNSNIDELSKEPFDASFNFIANTPIVISVGRLTRCKDYPNLLKAFSTVVKENSAQLVIVGEGPDKKKLIQLTNKLGLLNKVIFTGFQKNPFKYIKKASVFVLSSITEGLPNVLLEAMACGTPIVSTNYKYGADEIIKNGKNGLLVPMGNTKSLAEAIIKLLKDRSLRDKFSREGKIRSKDFTIEKKIKEYEQLFLDIVKN